MGVLEKSLASTPRLAEESFVELFDFVGIFGFFSAFVCS